MKVSMAGKMAISAVLSNKMRSFLTMLGIIIGVMSVVLLISLVQGATDTVTEQLDDLGGDQLIVTISSQSKRMSLSEAEAIADEPDISYVSPTISGSGTAVANNKSSDISITGVTESYDFVQGYDLYDGRGITQTDNDYRLNVAVVGHSVAQDLFGTQNVLDETIRVSGMDYRIVGVLEEGQETLMGGDNDSVYIPFTNAQRLLSQVAVTSFYAVVSEDSTTEDAQNTLNSVLMQKFGDDDDFNVLNMQDIMDMIDTVMGAMSLLLGAIAAISLLVGGIGIMNIMLVSVTERTREIGIRKAIGAQKSDIIVQFLIESVVIAILGGIIGMVLSFAILTVISTASSYSFPVSGQVAAIALGFSAFVGIVFGIYPANKAANLKPINALRYE